MGLQQRPSPEPPMSHVRRLGAALKAGAAAFLVLCVEFFSVPWRRVGIALGLLGIAVFLNPPIRGVLYRTLSKFTVKEIFSERRAELQRVVEKELKDELSKDGVNVRAVFLGNVDLPPQYRQGMEGLLAEELATQKMKYTLELKEKQ